MSVYGYIEHDKNKYEIVFNCCLLMLTFCILLTENLDELETMVINLFTEVENKNVTVPEWLSHPFGKEQCRKIGYVVPVKDIRNLYITFPTPDLHPHYKTAVSEQRKFFICPFH